MAATEEHKGGTPIGAADECPPWVVLSRLVSGYIRGD
jgi:hypothetical protein